MSNRLKIEVDRFADIVKSINSLVGKEVLVGIPEDKAERENEEEQGPMNNATLGYIHENGSPKANIPARPFLVPGIRDAQGRINDRLKKAATAALDGKQSKVMDELMSAGIAAQNSVKSKIVNGPFVPLKPATIMNRWRSRETKTKRKGEKAYAALLGQGMTPEAAQGEANIRPLINTTQLEHAISYVVKSA